MANEKVFGLEIKAVKIIDSNLCEVSLEYGSYIRKYNESKEFKIGKQVFRTTLDGVGIYFLVDGEIVGSVKLYETKGVKKLSTAGFVGSQKQVEVKAEKPASAKVVNEIKHAQYNTIKSCLQCNIPVYLAGPAGSGKNYTVEQIAKELGWNFYFSNSVQQEYKLTGFIDAGGKYHETEFFKACIDANDCVFFLDEMDASIPEVLVLLNAAIANGYFEFPNGRVDLKKVHFVAAGNTVGSGADELYSGRMVIDSATMDRFAIIEFDYDRNVELKLAEGSVELVDFIEILRKQAESKGIRAVFSYRAISMITKLMKTNMAMTMILKITVFKGMDKDTIKLLVNAIVMEGDNEFTRAVRKVV